MLIQKYRHTCGDEKWVRENEPVPGAGWTKVKGQAKYIKNMTKKASEAEDLVFAKENKNDEVEAINKYTERLKKEMDPGLRKATEHALKEEKEHKEMFGEVIEKMEKKAGNKYLEKIAGPVSKFVKGNITALKEASPATGAGVENIVKRMNFSQKKGYLSAADKAKNAGHKVEYPHSHAHVTIEPFKKPRGQ